MVKVWMLFLLSFSVAVNASEFPTLKLTPQFEQYLTRSNMKSAVPTSPVHQLQLKALAISSNLVDEEQEKIENKIRTTVLGSLGGGFTNPIPSDGEDSLLYDEIRRNLEDAHQGIGEQQVRKIDELNQQFNMGSQNFSGFSWQKPFGVVHVHADRQVNPNLFGTNWLVQDQFTFEIEATSFLEKLNEAGFNAMSDLELGAYAGITFKRVYTYYHYANSYAEGIRADFTKLFLPFLRFNQTGIEKMGPDEIMKRSDDWTVRAGGIITTPPLYNISFSGGILAEYAFQQMVSVQNNVPADSTAEKIRLTVQGKKSASVDATMNLQLDFFRLIKFSLLSYDMTYDYASTKEFTLGMSTPQLEHVVQDAVEGNEFRSILRGFGSINALEPYVVRLDESTTDSHESRGSILIWGKLQKNKTEQVHVIKDGQVKLFFKNYAQNVRVVQNFFSRLFSAVVYKLFKLPLGAKNAAIYSRQMTLEYEANLPQSVDPKLGRIEGTEQFSFILTQSYEAARTDRWIDNRYKNDIIWFVGAFTTLEKKYMTLLKNEELKGPLVIESNLRIEKAGFNFFLLQPTNNVFAQMAEVCGSTAAWTSEAERTKLLKAIQTGAEACVKNMGIQYLAFKTDYQLNPGRPSLVKFKDFLAQYYKQSETLIALQKLFGVDNTFLNGKLSATTSLGSPFNTSFSAGQFRGLGVIDNFKRSTGSRTPASIISE